MAEGKEVGHLSSACRIHLIIFDNRLKVPFRYVELNRPALPGPFPLLSTKSERGPKTLFEFVLRSRRSDRNNVDVHVSISHHW